MNQKRKKAVVISVIMLSFIVCICLMKGYFSHNIKNKRNVSLADTEKSESSDTVEKTTMFESLTDTLEKKETFEETSAEIAVSMEETTGDIYERKITNLGIPLAEYYTTQGSIARCTYDIIAYNGRVYVGGGDDDRNLGHVPSWTYDESEGKWYCIDSAIPEEKIRRFQIIQNKLMFGGTDPREDWDYGNYYELREGRWIKYRNIDKGAHNYDLFEYKGAIFIGTGSTPDGVTSVYPVMRSTDNGQNFEHVNFYKNNEPLNIVNQPLARVYNFVEHNDRLYCFLWVENNDLTFHTFELYSYNDIENAFYFVNDQSFFVKNKKYNPRDFTAVLSYGGSVMLVNENGLYVTDDFVYYDTMNICGTDIIRDMSIYNDSLYVLGDIKLEDGTYKSCLCRSSDGIHFEMVVYILSEIPACYFTLGEKGYYFGMGNRDFIGNALLGSVYFAEY